MNIYDSGLVAVSNTTKLWSGGTINLDGGTLDVGILDLTLGTFNMLDGYLQADSLVDNINVQGGVLAPSNSPGTNSFEGDVVMGPSSTTEIELVGIV